MPIIGVLASSMKGAPGVPTIGTATDVGTGRAYNDGAATVTFTPAVGGAVATSFTATSSPGGFTATGASSPLTVTGLQSSVSYTFTVTASNAAGTSAASSASNSITATTVPQAPTIGTATAGNTTASVTFTANANGGKTVSTFTATSSPSSITGSNSASPITVSGLTNGTAYTFTVTATNANGTSTASAASNSVTPAIPNLSSWSNVGTYPVARNYMASATGGGYLWSSGGNNGGPQTQSYRSTNGSSWSSIGDLPAARWNTSGAFDGTYYQQFVGLDSGNTPTSNSYFNNGSSWSTGTALTWPGEAGRAWSIGSSVGVNAYWSGASETNTYYRTGTGAWTQGASLATSATLDGFIVGAATNRNDRSVAYGFIPQQSGAGAAGRAYSNSSISGAWSTYGPTVNSITWNRPNIGYVNTYLFLGGGEFNTTVVRGDGSTWSSQTALPASVSNWAGSGGLGNDWYVWGGNVTNGSTFSQAVYKATQN